MIREVDLISYLPPFMQDNKEPVAALEAENPEFQIIWKATDRVLKNRFISTADEYGISRFERLLNIYPSEEDDLESRRSKVQSRWFDKIPYTMQVLLQKLTLLCRDTDFSIICNFNDGYTMSLSVNLEEFGKISELEEILNGIVPCNIVVKSNNFIQIKTAGKEYLAGTTSFFESVTISN